MAGREGEFIASLSAIDPEGVEGGGYLWSEEQLTRLLPPEELVFARAPGDWRVVRPTMAAIYLTMPPN